MEAKDTVMKPEEVIEFVKKYCGDCRDCATNTSNYPKPKCFNDAQLKAQAEISFRAGIEEVVEWVEGHDKSNCMDCFCAYDFCEEEWQAQLKEWGIKT